MTRVPTHRLSPAASATSIDAGDDWRHRAACRDEDAELFHPVGETSHDDLIQIAAAKAVCARCPVMNTCQREALDNDEAGVWGGLSERERRAMKRSHKQRTRRTNPTVAPARKTPTAKTDPNHRPTCGTYTGYTHHTRKRERQCAACRAWKAEASKPATPAACGTLPGYRRHLAADEPACGPCRAAKAADSAQRRRQQRNAA